MNVFLPLENILEYCVCLSFKELIILLFVFYEIGYLFGKKKRIKKHPYQKNSNGLQLLSLQPANPEENNNFQLFQGKSTYQHSLKLIKQASADSSINSQSSTQKLLDSQKQCSNPQKSEDELTRDFLLQKINIEGKKIQSRGIFHMTLQKADNPKFIRKIQKHEIITDYEVPQKQSENNQLIPFGSQKYFQLNDQSTILEISTYENNRIHKYPIIEKKLIKTNEFVQVDEKNKVNIPMSPSLCENGKFNKFFKNPKKIGEGAFGIVYSVRNIFQGRQYAVKKLFIRSGTGQIKMETILNESIKEVNIISKYSHPNIIRFHTCWLQIANLNEAMTFNKIHFKQFKQQDIQIPSGSDLNFKKKKSVSEFIQVSYISSQANSDFAFENQSKNSALKQSRRVQHTKKQIDYQVVSIIQKQNCAQKDQVQNIYKDLIPVYALYIQMQLCPQGSLDKYLQKRKSINKNFAFLVIDQLLRGVDYLHSNGLVHRDLKPGNILINKQERSIKIGDFGLSAQINHQIQYGKIGTPSYIAPEIMQKKPIRKQDLHLIDVYSIGVIFFQLLNLFNKATKHEKLQKISKLKQSKIQLPGEFQLQKKLIKMMTKQTKRLSVKQIFQRNQYIELSRIVQQDTQIAKSWDTISGLQF